MQEVWSKGLKPRPTFSVSVEFGLPQACICGLFFLDPEDITSLNLGAIWKFSKCKGLPLTVIRLWGMKGPFLKPRCIDTVRA
jgi:hypothetical protein